MAVSASNAPILRDRDAQILRDRAAGQVYRTIAHRYHLSCTRIQKIVAQGRLDQQNPWWGTGLSRRAQSVLAFPFIYREQLFPAIINPAQLVTSTFNRRTIMRVPRCGRMTADEILTLRDRLRLEGDDGERDHPQDGADPVRRRWR